MRRTILLSVPGWLLLALVAGTLDAASPATCCAGESRLLFLDDLLHPLQVDESRDPWEERIETDRHDYTQSPRTVGRGVGVVEMGYTYFYNDTETATEDTHTTPELLCRFGITDDIELRVRWNYAWSTLDQANQEREYLDGAEDLRWGLKLAVTEQDCFVPESAVELISTVPTGGAAWSTEHVEFGVDYIYGWTIAERWNLGGSSGLLTQGLGDFGLLPEEPTGDRYLVWSQSVALGYELTERNTMYVEWYGLFSYALEDEFSMSIVNVGIDHYLTDDLVIDLRVGKGLTEDSDDFFAGIGGGFRF
jgi:hypothetical protein